MDTQGEKLISSERYPQKARGMLMMAIAATCFSLGGLLIKMIPWNPLTINGVRNLIAACVIGGFIRLTQHPLKWNFTVLTGAVCMAGVTTFFTIANKLTTAGNAIVLQYSAPVWIILLSFLFFRDKPDRSQGITIGFVLAGILCFFFDSLSAGKILGDLLALLSGLFYAGMFMLNRFEKGDALSSMFFGQLLLRHFPVPLPDPGDGVYSRRPDSSIRARCGPGRPGLYLFFHRDPADGSGLGVYHQCCRADPQSYPGGCFLRRTARAPLPVRSGRCHWKHPVLQPAVPLPGLAWCASNRSGASREYRPD